MPFKKGDPKTAEAGRRGGQSGKKYLSQLSKEEIRELGTKAGVASGERRRHVIAQKERRRLLQRKRRAVARAKQYEDDTMTTYME